MDSTNELEKRICVLWAKVLTAKGEEAEEVIDELKSAIHEREKLLAPYPLDST